MALSSELIDALKRVLRAQDLTYRDVATGLQLSEAAVKRMFSRRAMSLVRLEQLCALLDVGLAELSAEAARARKPLATLSNTQEQALVDDPALMLALFLTLNRVPITDVLQKFDFTEPQWIGLLVRLDRLGIIELLPGNRARSRTGRNFRWRADGPMERHFRLRLLGDYFRTPFDGARDALLMLSGSLGDDGARQLRQRLEEVAQEFDTLLARDASLPATQRHGVSLVLAIKPWMLEAFAPYRRAVSATDANEGSAKRGRRAPSRPTR